MNHWLGIALIAYLIGAVIEGVNAASQLSHSATELAKGAEDAQSESTDSTQGSWHIFVAIASVSICGAFLWPCRLIHRSIKGKQAT
ncbi:MAG: hypothetical protein WCA35_28215 [Kovacikia sp.]